MFNISLIVRNKLIYLLCDIGNFQTDDGKSFQAVARFDTEVELKYFSNGGILNTMIRGMLH